MNVLWMGLDSGVAAYRERGGRHAFRVLSAAEPADYTFAPEETAAEVVEKISSSWPVDLFVCWFPELYPPPRAIEDCPVKTAAAVSDWNIYSSQVEYNLARFDVALTDKPGTQALRLRGTTAQYFFPLYTHLSAVHRKLDIEKDIDVLFVGNLNHAIHVERGRCLERIAALSDRYRVVICGGRFGDDYTRLLNRAKIVFNRSVRREMNSRCFEALACGSLLFIEEDNIEVGDYLRDREEVVLYNEDNLVALIEHYLSRPDEAARITAQGHAKAASLAAENRLEALVDWLAARPSSGRRFRSFSPRERAFAEVVFYASSLVPGQQALAERLLDRHLDEYGDHAEFPAARACTRLARLNAMGEEERKSATKDILDNLRRACALAPEAAPLWLNLAFVCRQANAADAERRFLELALKADSCTHGNLLMGFTHDPYYVAWRRALAVGKERVEILWAAAAARLAAIELGAGRHGPARTWADQAVAWLPEVAEPYRLGAAAEVHRGRPADAAALLEQGLPCATFRADFRVDMVLALRDSGAGARAQALALESARLFDACPDEPQTAAAFRALAAEIG